MYRSPSKCMYCSIYPEKNRLVRDLCFKLGNKETLHKEYEKFNDDFVENNKWYDCKTQLGRDYCKNWVEELRKYIQK